MTWRDSIWRRKLWLILAVVWADGISKHWILQTLPYGDSRAITSFFHLTHVRNTGSAFGLFQNSNLFLLILSFVILGFLALNTRSLLAQSGRWGEWALPLVVGGAVGNIIDRLQYGYVVDFLDFRVWPVFNVADSAITVGTSFLALGLFLSRPKGS